MILFLLNWLFYICLLFLMVQSFWIIKTFIETRIRYKVTRLLKKSLKDLKSLKKDIKLLRNTIVIDGDGSEKSIYFLKKVFEKISKKL